MTTEGKRRGAPAMLWVLGLVMVAGGLIARGVLTDRAREDARVDAMFNDMVGRAGGAGPDYGTADAMLWVVGIGVLLLAVALVVQLVGRR